MAATLCNLQVNTQSCFLCKLLLGVCWLVDSAKRTTYALLHQQAAAKPWRMLCLCCIALLGKSLHDSVKYNVKCIKSFACSAVDVALGIVGAMYLPHLHIHIHTC